MKPNFALSLSSEGIRLLHRAAGGWRVVGDVALDADDLSGALADLRRSAKPFEDGAHLCKLLLPEAQVKYMTIDTPGMSQGDRRAAARKALDGATPYAVSDLVFDISDDGDSTHIAAVARETLAEAEAFATEHHFKPVSFATVPGEHPYLGEPFFGSTEAAPRLLKDGQRVEPDGVAVVEIGKAKAPEKHAQRPTPEVTPAPEPPTKTSAKPDPLAPSSGAEPAKEPTAEPAENATETPEPAVPLSKAQSADTREEPKSTGSDTTEQTSSKVAVNVDERADAPPAPAVPPQKSAETATPAKPAAVTPAAAQVDHTPAPEPAVPVEKAPDVAPDTPAPAVPKAPDDNGKTAEPAPSPAVPVEKPSTPTMQGPAAPPVAPKAAAPKPPAPAPKRAAPAPVKPAQPTPDAAEETPTGPELEPTPAKSPPLDPPRKPKVAPLPPLRAEPTEKAPVPAEPPKVAAPDTGFASRRIGGTGAPTLGGERRSASPTPRPDEVPKPDSSSLDAPRTAPVAAAAAAAAGFLSRRKSSSTADVSTVPGKKVTATPVPAHASGSGSVAERMTVFGARRDSVGGIPRFLRMILTAVLLLFLAAVAAWASVFLDDGLNLSRLFGTRSTPEVASAPVPAVPDRETVVAPQPEAEAEEPQTAALDPGLTEEDGAVLDALRTPAPEPAEDPAPQDLSDAQLEAKYAATGFWTRAPQIPQAPEGQTEPEDIYLASIDPISTAADAIALPALDSLMTDTPPEEVASPAAAGTRFAFGADGLVIPTSAGTVNPDGVTVYLGRPDKVPPQVILARGATPEEEEIETPVLSALANARPRNRPGDLVETAERAQFDGLTRDELADYRPTLRPEDLDVRAAPQAETPTVSPEDTAEAIAEAMETPLAAALPDAFESPTKFATTASRRPDLRPNNFGRIVSRAERTAPAPDTRVASAAAVAPRVVAPSIPSSASVAQQATVKNAINMRRINLIGVYGKPSNRRALVRLGNGRYQKVVVGDRIDGGRVAAIGENSLRYTKGSRTHVLEMPN